MGLAIKIKKADDGNLCAVGNGMALFEFRYEPEVKAWLFWIPGRSNYDPIKVERRAFPWLFFRNLCRAVYFLHFGGPLWTSEATTIVSGKSYIR